jgi:small subunit ribosomal protein S20
MPNTSTAKKRLKQSEARRLRNRSTRANMRLHVRKVREAVGAGDVSTAEAAFRLAAKKLDRAGAKNLIHRNTAARTISDPTPSVYPLDPARYHFTLLASKTGPSTHVRL